MFKTQVKTFSPIEDKYWDADVHLMANYYFFIGGGETVHSLRDDQTFLIKEIRTHMIF